MRGLLLTLCAFVLGSAAAEPPLIGALRLNGPVDVQDWHLGGQGRVLTVDATLVNRSDWWVGELVVDCYAKQGRWDHIDADVLDVQAETIPPGGSVSMHAEITLKSDRERWDIVILPYGERVAAPTPTPWPTFDPRRWPTPRPGPPIAP